MPATKTKRSLNVCCPECGAANEITIDLNCLDGTATCGDCSESFSLVDARDRMIQAVQQLNKVLAWIEAAPVAD